MVVVTWMAIASIGRSRSLPQLSGCVLPTIPLLFGAVAWALLVNGGPTRFGRRPVALVPTGYVDDPLRGRFAVVLWPVYPAIVAR